MSWEEIHIPPCLQNAASMLAHLRPTLTKHAKIRCVFCVSGAYQVRVFAYPSPMKTYLEIWHRQCIQATRTHIPTRYHVNGSTFDSIIPHWPGNFLDLSIFESPLWCWNFLSMYLCVHWHTQHPIDSWHRRAHIFFSYCSLWPWFSWKCNAPGWDHVSLQATTWIPTSPNLLF